MEGKIKQMNSRGFGFITSEEIDYFFHYTDVQGWQWKALLQKWLTSGKELSAQFDLDQDNKEGPKAKNVQVMNGSAS